MNLDFQISRVDCYNCNVGFYFSCCFLKLAKYDNRSNCAPFALMNLQIKFHIILCFIWGKVKKKRKGYPGEIPVPFSTTKISLFTLGVTALFKFQLKDKYSCLLGLIILLCNSPVTLLFLQWKYPISHR